MMYDTQSFMRRHLVEFVLLCLCAMLSVVLLITSTMRSSEKEQTAVARNLCTILTVIVVHCISTTIVKLEPQLAQCSLTVPAHCQ
jgi:ABC-type uncharacterized transport system permease subunit